MKTKIFGKIINNLQELEENSQKGCLPIFEKSQTNWFWRNDLKNEKTWQTAEKKVMDQIYNGSHIKSSWFPDSIYGKKELFASHQLFYVEKVKIIRYRKQ